MGRCSWTPSCRWAGTDGHSSANASFYRCGTSWGHREKPRESLLPPPRPPWVPAPSKINSCLQQDEYLRRMPKPQGLALVNLPLLCHFQASKLFSTAQSPHQMCASSLWRVDILCWSSSGAGQRGACPQTAQAARAEQERESRCGDAQGFCNPTLA